MNTAPTFFSLSKKKSKLNPGFKGMSEHRWEERALRFAEDHVLAGKLVLMPSPRKAAWMLKAFPPGERLALGSCPGSQAEGTANLLTPTGPCRQCCLGLQLTWTALHCSPLATSTWAETKHSRRKRKAKPRDSWRGTERPTGYVLSLGSLFFSLSFVTMQFLSPQQSTTTINIADRKRGNQRRPYPHASIQGTIHCLRSLLFNNIGL